MFIHNPSLLRRNPPLLALELEATNQAISVLLHLHATAAAPRLPALRIEPRLVALCTNTLRSYLGLTGPEAEVEMAQRAPLVTSTLRAVGSLQPDLFRAHVRELFPILADLTALEGCPMMVRGAVAGVLRGQVGSMVMGETRREGKSATA